MKKSKSDYRITEYDGAFQIQKKKTKTKTTGYFWWKKTIIKTSWLCVDNWGNFRISIDRLNYDNAISPFKDLKSAIDKIDIMIEGIKYHYLS